MTELIKYYNEDCMVGMARYPDKHFDLAIVDPPYGVGTVTYMPQTRTKAFGGSLDTYNITMATLDMNQRSNVRVSVEHSGTSKETTKGFGDENIAPPPEYFAELMRVSKHQIIWGGNYYMLPPSRGFIVWRKSTVSENFSMAMAEFAWMSFNENAKVWEGAAQGTTNDPRIHPTQKPVALYKWLLTNYAKEGDLILDTHVGSASSLIACHELGFDAVGFELDEDYYKASLARLQAVQKQVTFDELIKEDK